MIERRHHTTAASALSIALCATLSIALCAAPLRAGTTIDLASENVPSIHGEAAEEQFGYCLAAGDLDGDDSDELIVGAPGVADSSGSLHTGAVFVFRASDLDALSGSVPAADLAAWVIRGNGGGRFGSAVAAGDFDGDGKEDLAVSAPAAGSVATVTRGEVSVFFGGAGDTWVTEAGPDVILTGEVPGARLGTFVLAADINGDEAAELMLSAPGDGRAGSPRSGAVYVLTGEALREAHGTVPASEIAAAVITGENADDALAGLAAADTDGDGARELVLGACLADGPGDELPDAGRVYIVPVPGELELLSGPVQGSALRTATGFVERGFLGRSMSAGDLDYDGTDDLLVSAYGSRAGADNLQATGEAFILFGVRAPGNGTQDRVLEDPDVPRFRGESRSDMFGLPVYLADLNGDGSADMVAAARHADGPDAKRRGCGEVYVYWGSLRSVMAAKGGRVSLADITIIGGAEEDGIGSALLAAQLSPDEPLSLLVGAPNAPAAGEGPPVPRSGKLILLPGELLLR